MDELLVAARVAHRLELGAPLLAKLVEPARLELLRPGLLDAPAAISGHTRWPLLGGPAVVGAPDRARRNRSASVDAPCHTLNHGRERTGIGGGWRRRGLGDIRDVQIAEGRRDVSLEWLLGVGGVLGGGLL